MSDAQPDQQQQAPVFRLQKMYLKDLSFENPNAPAIFQAQGKQPPKVDINLGLKNQALGNDHYEVSLSVTATVTHSEEGKTLFIAEVEHAGVFLLQNIPSEHLEAVLAVDCPNMLFPFTRQILSQLTVDGGFIPFLLDPVNFLGLYQQKKQQQQQQQQAQ